MNPIQARDIKIFSDAANAFFIQTTGTHASVRTAYLLEDNEAVHWSDYQSCIELGGQYRGMVAFSAPRLMLTNVLLKIGEKDYSDANHNDITGEIANQMSGYVRRHFGEGMHISPPKNIRKHDLFIKHDETAHSFVIPITWDQFEAKLFVNIQKVS
jgi:chemotaxis protein CheX